MQPRRTLDVRVDGEMVTVDEGATVLEACDAAGRYVPRLCHYPGLVCCAETSEGMAAAGAAEPAECGLCVVRTVGGLAVRACATPAKLAAEVRTEDEGLRALRLQRLQSILAGHPHICLSCPDRDGCSREECSRGNPSEARCCEESGRCELGKLVAWFDSGAALPRRAVVADRAATVEGRIRRELGLCVGCGRCVRVCSAAPEAGGALEMNPGETGAGARPKNETLRASGCTFCGLCVMVCPTGALTAPGEAGARWLAGRKAKASLPAGVLPPEPRQVFTPANLATAPQAAGVFTLVDSGGRAVLIRGAVNLRAGLQVAADDPSCSAAAFFKLELHPLYTQRESELLARHTNEWGRLPSANDLCDDLFDEPAGK
jgi:predicted molibdopterin-dependent oxidoreductase YjgC